MVHDLTRGKIATSLVKFAIPLVLGNLFQLFYNAADGIIVGYFVGTDALAAVGICSPVMSLAILFLNGLCIGAGILMSMQYGAGDTERLERQISTTMLGGVAFSLVISVVGVIFSVPILRLLRTDESIIGVTASYLRVVFGGMVFTYLYNFFSATLRSLGDSKTPLVFIIVSSVLNVGLDIFFVLVFRWGVRGCALATVLSQAVSCLLCFLYARRNIPLFQLGKRWLVFDKVIFRSTVSYGWVSAMQQATVQLGKLGVQSIVNTMGVSVTAAFSAVGRIDDFAYVPEQNIAHAMSSLIAQNRGAAQEDRVKKGFKCGLIMELIYGGALFFIFFFFSRPIVSLFSKDPEVIGHGVSYLKLISFMYIIPAFSNALQGYFRGIGDLKVTLLSSFVNMGVRVIAALVLVRSMGLAMEALPLSYLAGWVFMVMTELPLLIKNMKGNKK